ncbi:beta-N-acetylhexosaminidase [Pontibacterium granulatum]|uniref:beta-N-acetylhexosaminidase n=1 Tax=Pontibacterium granulatum TaxID=2036029 RepID=UPI00249C20A9|nr:beta-N-acetylhexosaminidase [Pontibacterium granulatum]MDI3326072.1 beta-N-acetylhexosaminidase [Pontibacterium granulatum]
MGFGALFVDIDGTSLSDADRELLLRPQVAGVILFGRNTQSAEQTAQLAAAIHAVRDDLIVSVDQEGGRVQRLRDGVTRLPPMAALGRLYQRDAEKALYAAREVGYLMAAELRSLGVDLSFAPVLDLEYGRNTVIGDRAFAPKSDEIVALAGAFVAGMHEAGMAATGKHFPGHGWADADTHSSDAVDDRDFGEIWEQDLVPFRKLVDAGLDAVMPAHVLYPACSDQPAGFSSFWLQDVLRSRLAFEGVIFSDDLSMKAAHTAGGYAQRAEMALNAGCDVLLPCNNREGALEVVEYLVAKGFKPSPSLLSMRGKAIVHDKERLARGSVLCAELWQEVSDV